MVTLSNDDLVELTSIAQAATQDRWQWGHSGTSTLEEAVAYVAEQLTQSDQPDMHMVFVGDPAGDTRTVALIGNGPTSEANARYITALWPGIVLALIREVQAARAGRQ